MIIVVTHLHLKNIWKFFSVANYSRKVIIQTKSAPGLVKLKTRGFWVNHYTISAWESREQMNAFYKSGAHLEAMKIISKVAYRGRFYTTEGTELPDWKTAISLLDEGREHIYNRR